MCIIGPYEPSNGKMISSYGLIIPTGCATSYTFGERNLTGPLISPFSKRTNVG